MTDSSSSALRSSILSAIVGGLITITGTLFLALATGAWSSKETTADHRADIQQLDAKITRVLDAVCYGRTEISVCRR
jgi:hypothetical protein